MGKKREQRRQEKHQKWRAESDGYLKPFLDPDEELIEHIWAGWMGKAGKYFYVGLTDKRVVMLGDKYVRKFKKGKAEGVDPQFYSIPRRMIDTASMSRDDQGQDTVLTLSLRHTRNSIEFTQAYYGGPAMARAMNDLRRQAKDDEPLTARELFRLGRDFETLKASPIANEILDEAKRRDPDIASNPEFTALSQEASDYEVPDRVGAGMTILLLIVVGLGLLLISRSLVGVLELVVIYGGLYVTALPLWKGEGKNRGLVAFGGLLIFVAGIVLLVTGDNLPLALGTSGVGAAIAIMLVGHKRSPRVIPALVLYALAFAAFLYGAMVFVSS